MGLSGDDKENIAQVVRDRFISLLIGIHGPRMSYEECKRRVSEDCATICLLLVKGDIILTEKGGITNGLPRFISDKISQKDSSPQSEEFKDENEGKE